MSPLTNLRSAFLALFRRTSTEGEMDEELRGHVQNRAEDLQRRGLSRSEAERRARIEFGNAEKFKEECREERGGFLLETIWTDVRFGFRMLRKSPGFTAIAVLTLALGIGANTSIFSVVNALLLRPLPYPNAERLALIWSQWGNETRGPASGPELIELRKRSRSFEEIGGIWTTGGTITGTADPEQVRMAFTTANFLPLLAEKPEVGRFFATGEDRRGAAPLMILTYGLWPRWRGSNGGRCSSRFWMISRKESGIRDSSEWSEGCGRASRCSKRSAKRRGSRRSFAEKPKNTPSSRCIWPSRRCKRTT